MRVVMPSDPYIYMPIVGPVKAITLVRWIVPDGACVKRGEPICELETEKATAELSATANGTLRHLVPAPSVIAPGERIASISSGPA